MITLYFHIGTHKTGSTSIQNTLAKSRSDLASSGVFYPDIFPGLNAHHPISRLTGWGGSKAQPDKILSLAEWCYKEANEIDAHTVLISSESLSIIPRANLLEPFSKFFDVKVLLYVKRQDTYLESLYNQHVKSYDLRYSGSILDFNDSHKFHERRGFDYLRIARDWSEVFGEGAVEVREYPSDSSFGFDAVLDLFSLLKIDPPIRGSKRRWDNEGVPASAIPYLSYMNKFEVSISRHREIIAWLRNNFQDSRRYRLLDRDSAFSFLSYFRNSNEILFKKFARQDPSGFDIPVDYSERFSYIDHDELDRNTLDFLSSKFLET